MITIETTDDLKTCFALRNEVFVREQDVPIDEEQDDLDEAATHLLACLDGSPVGTARIVFQDDAAKIGRVCVLQSMRGRGLGVMLIRKAIELARTRGGVCKVKLGAQVDAIGFYQKFGFVPQGPTFEDAGIEHREMTLDLG